MRPLGEFHETVLGRASEILTVPQRVPLLRAGARPPSFPCRSLLVPTFAAPVAAVPSEQERPVMSPHPPAGGCREVPPVPVPSKAASRPEPSARCQAARAAQATASPVLWGEWSHLSRKPLQGPGHASVMKATAQQGSRSGTSGTSPPLPPRPNLPLNPSPSPSHAAGSQKPRG